MRPIDSTSRTTGEGVAATIDLDEVDVGKGSLPS
jgi:hypothetical protein